MSLALAAYTATSGVSQVRRDDKLVKRAVPVDRVERLVVGYKCCMTRKT